MWNKARAHWQQRLIVLAAVALTLPLHPGLLRADSMQAASANLTIWSGVFSEIQARRGEKIASIYCSGCHGPDLEGGDSGPKLVGAPFFANWNTKTVGDLFAFVKAEMPADAPDSLSPVNTANVIAYILERNKTPSGTQDLAVDRAELDRIQILDRMPDK